MCATGRCCQVAAEAESGEDDTEVGATCWWKAIKQQSLTSLISYRRCIFVAELLSLNLCELYLVSWY